MTLPLMSGLRSQTQIIDLQYRPHRFQLRIHNEARRFTVVVAHRRFGKTFSSIMTLIHSAVATNKQFARFGYVAPFLKQAKRAAWDYLKRFVLPLPGAVIREGDLSVDFPNGARISLYGADNPEGMRGIYFDGVVLDEMANFRPDVWPTIIRPTLSDRLGWAMFIGTPKGINQFSELYHRALGGGVQTEEEAIDLDEWAAMMFRVDETRIISDKELRSSRSSMSDAQYRQEWLCDFSASADNTLITIDVVSAACSKVLTPADTSFAARILAVDVARYGEDRSVILRRQGLGVYEPDVMTNVDNMTLASRVAAQIVEWKPDATFVDAGRGEGVIDRLRQLGHSVIEVNFGGKPADESYVNKRSEMWDEMSKWLNAGGCLPNNVDLKTDLCVPTYKFDAANRFLLESKDDIRKRGMRSPDIGDALALTFAYPVATRTPQDVLAQLAAPKHEFEYDPFARAS
jgi:hypothetical protein